MNVVIDEFPKTCYTWGYGGKTKEDLINTLGKLTIQHNSPVLVIDTRYHPNCSWDRNFCKGKLAKLIADQGCFYSHFKEFGNPEKKIGPRIFHSALQRF